MSLRIVTEPAAEPISLTEAKNYRRVDISTDDTLITNLIRAAREYVEDFQRRSLVVKTFELTIDGEFPSEIRLPYPPVISTGNSITYVDTDGVTRTLSESVYTVDTKAAPGRIVEAYNQTWPSVRPIINAITVTYIAGCIAKFTAAADTDVLTVSGRTYTDNDKIRLSNSGGALPAGLAAYTDYYVISASGNTMQLSVTEGGNAIDITDTGTGTHFVGELSERVKAAIEVLVGHWYEHRESEMDTRLFSVPRTVESQLWQDRVW